MGEHQPYAKLCNSYSWEMTLRLVFVDLGQIGPLFLQVAQVSLDSYAHGAYTESVQLIVAQT